jgi:hypothetical protein
MKSNNKEQIMKKTVVAFFLAIGLVSSLSADVAIGQKVYSQMFKDKCGISGTKFAASHTQNEWKDILDAGEFESQMKTLCNGNIDAVPPKFIPHLFDFAHEYASDSGNVPSC